MISSVSVLLLFLITTCPAWGKAKTFLDEIEKAYSKVEAIEGTFEEFHYPGGSVWKGRFIIARGGKMVWCYKKPPGKKIVSDGKFIYYIINRQRKIYYRKVKELPPLFFAWEGGKLKKFDIEEKEERGLKKLIIYPKKGDKGFKSATLIFDNRLNLVSVEVEDSLGDKTVVIFKEWKTKYTLPSETFTVNVPKGFTLEKLR